MTQEWKDIASYVVDLEQQVLRLKDQRDELAVMLTHAVRFFDQLNMNDAERYRAVLAKVEAE